MCRLQADERYRKNIQGSPQAALPKQQPPVPPRSSESFSNGNPAEAPAMHRPMEPQVTLATRTSLAAHRFVPLGFLLNFRFLGDDFQRYVPLPLCHSPSLSVS